VLGRVHDLATLRQALEQERERARTAGETDPERATMALLTRLARDERAAHDEMLVLPAHLAEAGTRAEPESSAS
jgi:hypothetical protein